MAQINKPSDYFQTKLYTGTGSSNSVDVGFQTDFSWIKDRGSTAYHYLYDTVRGAGKAMYSNDTASEGTNTNNLASFDTSGFTVGTGGGVNASGNNFVSWNWLGGGTASSNTDGSITSSVSASTTSGFSIVSYTGNGSGGATIGTGLNAVPSMVIVKRRDTTEGWQVFHASIGNTKYIELNSSASPVTASTLWNNTSPSSSVVTLGSSSRVNASSSTYIAYCFASKKGFSKVGSYTGNGSSDGTFVYLGFSPAFIIIKDITSTDPWLMLDNKRSSKNVANHRLFPNTNGSENTSDNVCDFLSGGIKFRSSNDGHNGSRTYIYYAVAEQPIVGTNNIPATAR